MKGFFSQGAALLAKDRIEVPELEPLLHPFGELRPLRGTSDWTMGNDGFLVPLIPSANGYLAVDFVERTWPDDMGDPQSSSMLFGAWSLGHFGPFAYPRGLQRAREQAWAWPEAKEVATLHTG